MVFNRGCSNLISSCTKILNMYQIDTEEERKQILKQYRKLLSVWTPNPATAEEDQDMVRRAFNLAVEAHRDMRRKSGEPYIYHPLAVAQICVSEIGLGATSIVCALLHDVVEDTDYTLEDIQGQFGEKVSKIIDGLTKIKGIFDNNKDQSAMAANQKKLMITLAEDVRVILIKMADRLHNMRTLGAMPQRKQLKISGETIYLYAPLAHRLGLYAIKSELEDLSLKYTEPLIYEGIFTKLQTSLKDHNSLIRKFIYPIKKDLGQRGYAYEIQERAKSVYSIWSKMKKKQIPFEEIYDIFAIRIILDVAPEDERKACWEAYTIITDHFRPKPDRIRDWITTPKANGYQALHITVMSDSGKWVEVQIRTRRMDEIAEKGFAAHWKYKGSDYDESNLEHWLDRIRDMLTGPDSNALDFMDSFQGYLFTQEIFLFTPQGELRILPAGSTVLDFAFAIHTELGFQCIGANVNHKLRPRNTVLKSGDQVEVLTSKAQQPREEWLSYVVTTRAKSALRQHFKEARRPYIEKGKELLKGYFNELGLEFAHENIKKFYLKQSLRSSHELYYKVSLGEIGLRELKNCCQENDKERGWFSYINPFNRSKKEISGPLTLSETFVQELKKRSNTLILNEEERIHWEAANCCHPIPGDDVMGFIDFEKDKIIVHRTQCRQALALMATFGNNVIKAKWYEDQTPSFLAGISVNGVDRKGLINQLTQIISNELNTNIKSFKIESNDGVFDGEIMLYITNINHLTNIISKIKKIKQVKKVLRLSRENLYED